MIKHNVILNILFVSSIASLAVMTPLPLWASSKDVVGSKYDGKVQTRNGSCVRTKWMAGNDPCAPEKSSPPPPPIVEPAPYVAPPAAKPVVQAPPPPPVARTIIKQEARTIYFDSGKDVITPGGEKKLDTLAQILKEAKDIQRVEIVGYADPMGSRAANFALSERRAKAVQHYLNEHGYMSTSVAKTKAVGDTMASADCSSKMKRAKKINCLVTDRKVEVQVVYATKQY